MARPLKGKFPIDVAFTCKMTKQEAEMLSDVAWILRRTKSEAVRLLINLAFCGFGKKEVSNGKHSKRA